MRINPNALVMWGFLAGLGYLAGGPHTALVYFVIALGISFFIGLLPDRR